jgi:predicted membrane protein
MKKYLKILYFIYVGFIGIILFSLIILFRIFRSKEEIKLELIKENMSIFTIILYFCFSLIQLVILISILYYFYKSIW